MGEKTFLYGALVLTAAGFVSRVLGAFYRIPLTRLIGAEGMGLFQMAYPVYTLLLVLSVAGIPVAVSKLVAQELAAGSGRGARRVFRVSLALLFFSGLAFSLFLLWSAPWIARVVLKDPGATLALKAVAPAILLLSLTSVLRGYFQGLQEMGPSALSQILEQLVRVGTMLGLAFFLIPQGVEMAAAGAAFGAVPGGLVALGVLGGVYFTAGRRTLKAADRGAPPRSGTLLAVLREIFTLAIPIVLGALILPVMQALDAAIVPLRLQSAGFSLEEARGLFGQLTGVAMSLVHFPTVLTLALATSLVPAISAAQAKRDAVGVGARAEEALRLTILFTLPASAGLWALSREISTLLFDLPEAGVPLAILSFGTLFLGLQQVTSGILQGLGRVGVPLKNLMVGALIKLVLNYTLTGIPGVGVRGAALATVVGFGIAALLNLLSLISTVGLNLNWGETLVKPGLGVVLMVIGVRATQGVAGHILNDWATLLSIGIGAGIYLGFLIISGGIRRKDVEMIPRLGTPLARIMDRLGIRP